MRTAFLLLFATAAAAQTFEAASIHPCNTNVGPLHFTVLPNRLDVKNINLGYLIRQAFDIYPDQLSGPDWLPRRSYDVQATAGKAVSKDEMRLMLQNLLRERFALATHWETREESVYRLQPIAGQTKLKPADTGFAAANSPMRNGGALQLSGPMSMRQLAESLSRFAGKPVIDETNLDGFFTISLTFAADDAVAPGEDPGSALPLPAALEKQLGLKLLAERAPVRHLVVDHANPLPSGN